MKRSQKLKNRSAANSLTKKMESMTLTPKTANRESMTLTEKKRQHQVSSFSPRKTARYKNTNGKREVANLPSNVWRLIAERSVVRRMNGNPNYALPLGVSKQMNADRTDGLLARMQPRHRQYIQTFADKRFPAVDLSKNQKIRLTNALVNLMIRRDLGDFNMPYERRGVKINQLYPEHIGGQGSVGRFNITINGIRLTQPVGDEYVAPPRSIIRHRGRVYGVGRDLNKAGWFRLKFEPYK